MVATVHMMSGQDWTVTPEDILLTFVDPAAVRRDPQGDADRASAAIIDHMLSMVLFIVMLVEFLLVAQAATSTFFLLMVISLVDVLGGFIDHRADRAARHPDRSDDRADRLSASRPLARNRSCP